MREAFDVRQAVSKLGEYLRPAEAIARVNGLDRGCVRRGMLAADDADRAERDAEWVHDEEVSLSAAGGDSIRLTGRRLWSWNAARIRFSAEDAFIGAAERTCAALDIPHQPEGRAALTLPRSPAHRTVQADIGQSLVESGWLLHKQGRLFRGALPEGEATAPAAPRTHELGAAEFMPTRCSLFVRAPAIRRGCRPGGRSGRPRWRISRGTNRRAARARRSTSRNCPV